MPYLLSLFYMFFTFKNSENMKSHFLKNMLGSYPTFNFFEKTGNIFFFTFTTLKNNFLNHEIKLTLSFYNQSLFSPWWLATTSSLPLLFTSWLRRSSLFPPSHRTLSTHLHSSCPSIPGLLLSHPLPLLPPLPPTPSFNAPTNSSRK